MDKNGKCSLINTCPKEEKNILYCHLRRYKWFSYFSWNCRKPGLTCGLAFSKEVVARGELDGRLGIEAGIWGMLPVSCFQASKEGGGEL